MSPDWLKERLIRHDGNADVVRQDLAAELGIVTSLRTIERAVQRFRQEIRAEALATVRFETPPGKQIQVDFGTKSAVVGGVLTRVHLCVLTLGYSRRIYVQAFRSERQDSWFSAIEGAFRHFGGVTADILVDNARALVDHNNGDGNVTFNAGFKAFCDHWGVTPKACRPYRARTKGKDERAVQYVKGNAMAGRDFSSWADLDAHLLWWMREVSDCRIQQTTREEPCKRFEKERGLLLPVNSHRPYVGQTTASRVVKTDTTVDYQGNAYSVPNLLIGKEASVTVRDGWVEITVGVQLVARHEEAPRCPRARVIAPEHLKGVMRLWGATKSDVQSSQIAADDRRVQGDSALLRPLADYEAIFDAAGSVA